jgi:multiple sugar transport system substrate-binding protein
LKTQFWRTASAGVLAAMLGLSASAAFAGPIKVWHHGGRGDGERGKIGEMLDAWNKANPNDFATLEILPEGAYTEQVQAAALAGNLPDLLDFDGPNYANYVWSGYLQPLNGIVSEATIANAIPSLIAQGTYGPDGKLYSLGMGDSGLAMWGNKAILTKAGVRIPAGIADAWTLAEFEDAMKKIADSGNTPLDVKLNYGKGEWFTYGFSPILQSMGGDLIDRTSWKAGGMLDGDASVKAMTHFQTWVKNGWVVPASAGDDAFYVKKNVGISFVGHWMWPAHSKALGDDLVLIPMPKFGDKQLTGNGGWCWGVTKTTKDPAAVGRLMDYLLSDPVLGPFMESQGGPPGTKTTTATSSLYKPGGKLQVYADQLANGIGFPRPVHPAYPVITASFAQAVADIVDGGDVKASLSKAAAAIDENIADNKGYPPFGK